MDKTGAQDGYEKKILHYFQIVLFPAANSKEQNDKLLSTSKVFRKIYI